MACLIARVTAPTRPDDAIFLRRLRKALARGAPDGDFGVVELARALEMSRSTLYRRVDALLGSTPMDLLWAHRLELAAASLRTSGARVGDVADAAGFRSPSHFCRRFRERFGASPTHYRNGSAPSPNGAGTHSQED